MNSTSSSAPKETDAAKRERLRKQLDAFHQWPSAFTFKFILPSEPISIAALKGCFGEQARFSERPSKKGNYVAFTIEEVVSSAEAVFERYEQAGKISGIISL
jgi:hypothetical protein